MKTVFSFLALFLLSQTSFAAVDSVTCMTDGAVHLRVTLPLNRNDWGDHWGVDGYYLEMSTRPRARYTEVFVDLGHETMNVFERTIDRRSNPRTFLNEWVAGVRLKCWVH